MGDDLARLAYLLLLAVAVGGFLVVEFRKAPGRTSRQVLAWGLIFTGAVAAAGLWQDHQSRRQIAPVEGGGARLTVPLDASGHADVTLEVNGVPVRFVVDTGATQVALRRRDAARIGIDPDGLAYAGQANTANGLVRTAAVRLDTIAFGPVVDRDIPAVVIDGDLGRSLLGMSYLGRFARISLEGRTMVLER